MDGKQRLTGAAPGLGLIISSTFVVSAIVVSAIVVSAIVVSAIVASAIVASAAGPAQAPQLFATADRCVACHNGLQTPAGEDASFGTDWQASMMAHAARDPYWQASVRREVLEHPVAQAALEGECSACHMPMAAATARAAGGHGSVFHNLPVGQAAGPAALLAADGVSCTMCHQIEATGLGEPASFTAGYSIKQATGTGQRPLYGPFAIDQGRITIMQSASRFVPTQGSHVQSSELCATCHTLITHALNEQGEVIGELPEQVPYLEWQHSAYAGSRSCQSCHMPEVAGEMAITAVMGLPRSAVSRHVFRGGNFFLPKLFARYRTELGVVAPDAALERMAQQTSEHLGAATAGLTIEQATISDQTLQLQVVVESMTGHKLPTAYPSRRAWLHLLVHDAAGAVLFESGKLQADGSIQGNDNDEDGSRFEPHYTTISSPEQVQIYEPIMGDAKGAVTTVLLSAVRYLKDNRLPPAGFDKATAAAEIAVHGRAADDPDLDDGQDLVAYQVAVAGASGPLTVTAELWYQPIGFRWARNLEQQQGAEISRFVTAYDELAGSSAVQLAATTVTVGS